MLVLLWDASAFAKRYLPEIGSPTVAALLTSPFVGEHVSTFLGFAETAAIIRRSFNRGVLPVHGFHYSRALLRTEVLANPVFGLVSVEDADYLLAVDLVDRHNLNASDAAVLNVLLRTSQVQCNSVLIASDRRLLRAAQAEGLQVLNPEQVAPDDLPTLLASLAGP